VVDNYSLLLDSVTEMQGVPQGKLCISTSVTFGDTLLAPILSSFLDKYPQLSIDLKLSDQKIDMLKEGVDVVIRIGSVDDSNLIAKKINDLALVLCASPDFIQRQGAPQSIAELAQYNCIIDSNFKIGNKWPFIDKSGHVELVSVNSNVSVNSPRSVLALAISGTGIALLPRHIANRAIDNKDLVVLLSRYSTASFSMYAIYPHRRYLTKKVRCFIDFLMMEFSEKNLFN
jgi:DNA-binding transcriptional LysR family regulator